MLTSEQFFQYLRSALNHLYDPYFLRKSPLITVFELGDQPDTPSLLQHILNDAIAKMEPLSGDAALAQQRRHFELIMYRYVQQFNQEEVANQLGLSVRHLRREQNTAIYDLAARLWNQYQLGGARPFQISLQELDEASPASDSAPAPEEPAPPASDLSWLESASALNPADLRQVLPAILELSRPLADRYNVTFELNMGDSLPLLSCQEVALRQLLLNALSVAMRWQPNARLVVRAGHAAPDITITILCSGLPGSARILSSDEKASLALTGQIAKVYGGRLEFDPSEPDFCLVIRLPACQQHLVMVVDDNLDFSQLVERYLAGSRYAALSERDPRHAVAAAEQARPDVILLDVMMPQVDGWEVLGRLRRHPATANIPVIICSIVPQHELAISLGAVSFLRKPVSQDTLLAALDAAISLPSQN